MRIFKRPPQEPLDPYKSQPLPVGKPAAVYYRQSSEAQIGNISTTLQTVDMVEHLLHLGWVMEQITMIDMDAGVSGTKRIQDRPGMSMLVHGLIERGRIGLVAAVDVDRFFRDITMIQVNIFIDACKRNNVQVLTPRMVYDFTHATFGSAHIKLFREEAQRAADYLEYQIQGRLVKSRNRITREGKFTWRRIVPGFMVDRRPKLPDGSPNPTFRKYVRYALYADVILAYYQKFREAGGNLDAMWKKLLKEGPFLPEFDPSLVPEGFYCKMFVTTRSPDTGRLVPSYGGLITMLTNVAYIGHWVHKDSIVQWNNHEAIIPLDLFMYAFNRLSKYDFNGDPNLDYVRYRPWVRHPAELRGVESPTYEYLAYSDDLAHRPHQRLSVCWSTSANDYKYLLYDYPFRRFNWNIKAEFVDRIVDELLLERLKATTVDEAAWQQALSQNDFSERAESRRLELGIRAAKQAKENIAASLSTLRNPELIRRAEAQYEAADAEITALTEQLNTLNTTDRRVAALHQARPALQKLLENWERVPRPERRALFEGLAQYIKIHRRNRAAKEVTIHWRDGSTSSSVSICESRGYFWQPEDLERLRQLVESNADQIEILRAFPRYTFKALQERYAYNFTKRGRWGRKYQGKRTYPSKCKWEDTREARAEARAGHPLQLPPQGVPSYASYDRP